MTGDVGSYFITGTGRCGTMLLAKLFDRSAHSVCGHETIFRHLSLVTWWRDQSPKMYHEDLATLLAEVEAHNARGQSFGVSSCHMYMMIREAWQLLRPGARFILMLREPSEFIRSAEARGFFNPEHPKYCRQIELDSQSELGRRFAEWSSFERTAWYWYAVNSAVLDAFQYLPESVWRVVRSEDMSVAKARELCRFLALDDLDDATIESVVGRRINATPGQGADDHINPNSLPFFLPPYSGWTDVQKAILERHCGALCQRLYGYAHPPA